MSIIHVGQIEAKLKSMFSSLIDVSDYEKCTEAEQNSAFLTRALAAYSILVTADISQEEAAGSVVDGFQDGGIDAREHPTF